MRISVFPIQNVEEFKAGTMPSAIEVIAGPYTSRQSSYQMINGHTSSTSSVTYTYTLYIAKPGVYTIAPACARFASSLVTAFAVPAGVNPLRLMFSPFFIIAAASAAEIRVYTMCVV